MLATKPVGQPGGEWDHHYVGASIAGGNPSDLCQRGSQVALNVRHRNVDDAGVDHLKDGAQRRGQSDNPLQNPPISQSRRGGREQTAVGTIKTLERCPHGISSGARAAHDEVDRCSEVTTSGIFEFEVGGVPAQDTHENHASEEIGEYFRFGRSGQLARRLCR